MSRAVLGIPARVQSIDWSDDSGQVGGIEVLPFGLLVFVVGTLLVAQAWSIIDIKSAVNAASREGVRVFVESDDASSGRLASERVAREAIGGHGRDPDQLRVDPPDYHGGSFQRCAEVTISVSYPVPAISLPIIGTHGRTFEVTSSHTELIDPYRSGVSTGGGC